MIKIGALFLNRKRPGFDPEWGRLITSKVKKFLTETQYEVFIPDINITDYSSFKNAISVCKNENVNVLIVLQPTLSDGNLAASLATLWDKPFILWATPTDTNSEKIKSNSLVGTHIFASTLSQFGRKYEIIYGMPDQQRFVNEFHDAVRLISAQHQMSTSKVGLIGYQSPGYINVQADASVIYQKLGIQLYHIGLHVFIESVKAFPEDKVSEDIKQIKNLNFKIRGVDQSNLELSSRYYLAMNKFIEEENLDALSIRCWPELPNVLGQWPYLAMARLLSEQKAVGCEGDVDGAITCMLGNSMGFGPGYLSDWLEHDEKTIATWHTGNSFLQLLDPSSSNEGPVITTHFNNQKPTVVEGTLKSGLDVTIARLWRCNNQYHVMAFDAETIPPKRHLEGTNGFIKVKDYDCYELFKKLCYLGMPHHIAVFEGHNSMKFKNFARISNINYVL